MGTEGIFGNKTSKSFFWTVYVIIFFEMLYMATPFAVFFYSVYGMPLKKLAESSWTVWLVQYSLPHFSQTQSFLINTLLYISWPLMGIGFVIFIVGFSQIYWAKFRHRDAVTGGLYTIIRHPQYVAWAIFGLGMAIFWSRMVVLIMYVSMLFVYYLLAIREEKECLDKYGESYRSYLQQTGRFVPRIGIKRHSASGISIFQRGPARKTSLLALYFLAVGATIGLGFLIRAHTLSEMFTMYEKDAATVSVTSMDHAQMRSILAILAKDQTVRNRMDSLSNPLKAKRLNYIMPLEWRIPELGMEKVEHHERTHGYNPTNHGNPSNFDPSLYKVLISGAVVDQDRFGKDILSKARGQKPLLIIEVDLNENRVMDIKKPPEEGKYGDLPVAMF